MSKTTQNEVTLQSKFADLSGPELLTMHRVLSEQYVVEELFPTPKRFASRAAGIKRIEKLVEYLNAKVRDDALRKHKSDKATAAKKGKAIAKAIKPQKTTPSAKKKSTKKKVNGATSDCTKIWKKMVTPKLKCTRMDYIRACESKGLSRWVAVSVWGNMAKDNNIKNPTQLANERNQEK